MQLTRRTDYTSPLVTTATRSSTPLATPIRSFNELIARPNRLPNILTLSADALANRRNAPLEDAFAVALAIFAPGSNLEFSYPSLRLLRSKWLDEWLHEVMHNKMIITLPAYTTLKSFLENSDTVFGVAYNGTIFELWKQVTQCQMTGVPIPSRQFVVTRSDSMTMWFAPSLTEEERLQFKPPTQSPPTIKVIVPSYLQCKAEKSGTAWVRTHLPSIDFFRGLSGLFVSTGPDADPNHMDTHGHREKIDFLRDIPLQHWHRRSDNLEIQTDIKALWEPILNGGTNEYDFSFASVRTILLLDPVVPAGAVSTKGNTVHLFCGNREGVVLSMADNTKNPSMRHRCIVFMFTSLFKRTRIYVQGDGCPSRKDLLEGTKQHLTDASDEMEVTNVQVSIGIRTFFNMPLTQEDPGRPTICFNDLQAIGPARGGRHRKAQECLRNTYEWKALNWASRLHLLPSFRFIPAQRNNTNGEKWGKERLERVRKQPYAFSLHSTGYSIAGDCTRGTSRS